MFRRVSIAVAATMIMAGTAVADPIEGDWKTAAGSTAGISSCGSGFCIKLKTGKYAGKSIGKLSPSGGRYAGSITDPETDKTYSGKASVSGSSLSLKGCVLGGLICKSQTWNKL